MESSGEGALDGGWQGMPEASQAGVEDSVAAYAGSVLFSFSQQACPLHGRG